MSDTDPQAQTGIAAYKDPSHNAAALILDQGSYQSMHQIATLMASGKTSVPQHLRGNTADCMAIVLQAMQWQMNPFAVAQKTFIVNGGQIGYEAQLVNAVITTKAPVTGRLQYEWFGDWEKILGVFREVEYTDDNGKKKKYRVPNWTLEDEKGLGIRVQATFIGESTPRVLETLMLQARTRNSTLWADDPKQQIAYLATKKWARLYCPDVIMGVYTPDEFGDNDREIDITPQVSVSEPSPSPQVQRFPAKTPSPEIDEVIAGLVEIAKKQDLAAYEVAFKALTGKQRVAIGAQCHEALKSLATIVDADFTEVPDADNAQQQAESSAQ